MAQVKGLSFFIQMLPGWKVTIFNAAGVSVQQFLRGRAPLLTNLAVAFVAANFAIVLFHRATHGALPSRAPSTRRTAGGMHHVWRRHLAPSLAALAAQVLFELSVFIFASATDDVLFAFHNVNAYRPGPHMAHCHTVHLPSAHC